MKSHLLIYMVLVPALLLGSCQKEPVPAQGPKPINLDQKSLQLLQTSNHFAFDIFKEIALNEEGDDNFMISPLSMALALAMTYNGANGDTKEAFEKVLHLNGLSVEEINQSYQKLISALLSVDPKVMMEIANSIWYRDNFYVEDDFLNINKNYYDAEVTALNFANPASVDIINNWVSDKTHDKIDEIIEEIDPMDIMFLINAVYFKGIWKYQFNKDDTKDEPFYKQNGDLLKDVKTMSFKEKISYASNDLFQAVELPYGQGNFTMVVLLPKYNVSLNSLVSEMNPVNWESWMESFSNETEVNVYLPKFKVEYKKELKPDLIQLGMGIAFSGG
ncbi:MAG: serpin family protein, partial [Bacteroidota bacterium]|nr:serpin family protein [Bacteroidota bacterium]